MLEFTPSTLAMSPRRWQPLAGFGLAVGNRPTYGGGDLFVQGDRAVGVDVCLRRGTRHNVIIRWLGSVSTCWSKVRCATSEERRLVRR